MALTILMLLVFAGCEEIQEIKLSLRERITGSWQSDEDSDLFDLKSTAQVYSVFIDIDEETENGIYISNFYGVPNLEVYAEIEGNEISLPEQTYSDYTIHSGTGIVSNNAKRIDWEYVVSLGGEKDNATAVYTRGD